MEQNPRVKFKMVQIKNMPMMIILLLKWKGRLYPFSFILHPNNRRKERYTEVCEIPDKQAKDKLPDVGLVLTGKPWNPKEYRLVYNPWKNKKEAIETATFWAKQYILYKENLDDDSPIDSLDVKTLELDEPPQVLEIG